MPIALPDISRLLVILAMAWVCVARSGAIEPSPRDVRDAVQRSLPYIEKVSVTWMHERKCNSCHNVTFLIWSHNEAAARGFDVDRQKLAEWTKWSLADSLSDRFWFKLRPAAWVSLKADGVAESSLAKLKPLEGKTYLSRDDYLHALEKVLGSEDFAAYKDRLLKQATLPNNGGGPDTLSQLLLGQAKTTSDATSKSYFAIRSLLLQWQEPDGSWQAQGQLPGLKWNEKEMHEATTMWSILALSAGTSTDAALERGLASLKNSEPGITLQSLALHLIIAHRFGDAARSDTLRKQLLELQRADGGWAWVKQNKESDAFSTGQALYALSFLGRDEHDPAMHRACAFLLRTQNTDGSWQVPQEAINKRHRSLNVYNYWGTAWATIGMLQTLPLHVHFGSFAHP